NMNMYRSFMPGAKKYKVKICLENLFGNYKGRIIEGACTEVSEACAYIDALNAEAGEDVFGLCLDIGHATLMRRNLYQYIKALGPRLTCLHIHDNDGQDDLHMMPFTYTHTWGKNLVSDWDGFINGLRDINYQGDLCFETFRVLESFPRDLWDYAFRLISATGRYFVKRIESET
ncbi:MAG: sugar phosphate isomerase/epimerase, partial [Clostridia bacterium]|nr:sugar phosphate isomerase/epimerase [Clostridia bacterium]